MSDEMMSYSSTCTIVLEYLHCPSAPGHYCTRTGLVSIRGRFASDGRLYPASGMLRRALRAKFRMTDFYLSRADPPSRSFQNVDQSLL